MAKTLDMTKTVYELVQENPEVTEIMSQIGFPEITQQGMLESMGKITTIPQGANNKGVKLSKIVKAFEDKGFKVENIPEVEVTQEEVVTDSDDALSPRVKQIKAYLERLNNGESLEEVREDFVKNFSNVEAREIMDAEQALLAEGVPLEEVQKLCDVHSALFHGNTREEQIANAELEVAASIQRAKEKNIDGSVDKNARARELEQIPGHPLNTLSRENKELEKLIEQANAQMEAGEDLGDILGKIRPVVTHYQKKGDLLYPHLKVEYGVIGPSNVMWTVDDEIRDEVNALLRDSDHNEEWTQRAKDVIKRIEEMIYKEENILFPASALSFTEDEWKQLYHDLKDYKQVFDVVSDVWPEAEAAEQSLKSEEDDFQLPGGSLKLKELEAMMKTLPIEVTFIDENDINKYFNEGPKVFKRPSIALGHDVFSCHPPKVEKMVRSIIDDFKNKKRDQVQIWMTKEDKPFLVTYMAVRDNDGKYLGTMELVQEMEDIQKHYEKALNK